MKVLSGLVRRIGAAQARKWTRVGLIAATVLCATHLVHATPIQNGSFEPGNLSGWQSAGDVSVQTSVLGTSATSGSQFAWVAAANGAFSYSGNQRVAGNLFASLGFPRAFVPADQWPTSNVEYNYPPFGFDYSYIKQDVAIAAGEAVSFDFNFITQDGRTDYAFVFAQSLDQSNPYSYLVANDFAEPLNGPNTYQSFGLLTPTPCRTSPAIEYCDIGPSLSDMPLSASAVDLCNGDPFCSLTTQETGWHSYTWQPLVAGNYAFYIGVVEQVDSLVASALAVDNIRVQHVPEPGTAWGLAIALLSIAMVTTMTRDKGNRCSAKEAKQGNS